MIINDKNIFKQVLNLIDLLFFLEKKMYGYAKVFI